MSENVQYDGTFMDNVMVVQQTGWRMADGGFGDGLISVDWVYKINLTKSREDEIRECFSYTSSEFHYPYDLPDFNLLIETFQKDTLDDENQ